MFNVHIIEKRHQSALVLIFKVYNGIEVDPNFEKSRYFTNVHLMTIQVNFTKSGTLY